MLIAFLVCIGVTPAAAVDFTWSSQLGQSSSAFVDAVSRFYNCSSLSGVEFILGGRGLSMQDNDLDSWSRALPGAPAGFGFSFVDEEKLRSSQIGKIICHSSDSQAAVKTTPIVSAYVFEGAVFRVTLNYHPVCKTHLCGMSNHEIDASILLQASKTYDFVPDASDYAARSDFDAKFAYLLKQDGSRELFQSLKSRCWIRYTEVKYRCFVAATVDESVWYSIAAAEVITSPAGWLEKASQVRVVLQQQFASLGRYDAARKAFSREAEAGLSRIQDRVEALQKIEDDRRRFMGIVK